MPDRNSRDDARKGVPEVYLRAVQETSQSIQAEAHRVKERVRETRAQAARLREEARRLRRDQAN